MIIGSEFSEKYQRVLLEVGRLAKGDTSQNISVQKINADLNFDRIEIKNVLEYLRDLQFIEIKTIGGPLLYGHITITESGLDKYRELKQ